MKTFNNEQFLVRAAPIIFVLLWSTGYLCGRILRPHVDPLTFSAFRFAAASLLLVGFAAYRGAVWPKKLSTWLHLSVCGILIQGFFIAGMMVAVNIGLDMGIAALVGGMQPILTAVLALFLLRERFSSIQQIGFALGFIGLALVLFQGSSFGSMPKDGLVVSVFAVFGITLGTLYQKKFLGTVDLLSGTAIQFAAAFLPIAALAILLEDNYINWGPTVILTTVWLVVVQSIGAVLILFAMIRAGAVSRVSSLFYLVPPLCALQGYFIFDEGLTVMQIIGILVVTFSVAMINRQAHKVA